MLPFIDLNEERNQNKFFSKFQNHNGYENITDEEQQVNPPWQNQPDIDERDKMLSIKFDKVVNSNNESSCRDALMNFATSNCCYGKGVITNMVISKLDNDFAYHVSIFVYIELYPFFCSPCLLIYKLLSG